MISSRGHQHDEHVHLAQRTASSIASNKSNHLRCCVASQPTHMEWHGAEASG